MDQNTNIIENRAVRIFISSTFEDLQEERDKLVQKLVANLKRTFSNQNISIYASDLRWGIKDNEILQGNLMNICFREIDKCRPFFIGILADNYGTAHPLSELCDKPYLNTFYELIKKDYPEDGLSATELEIQYAVLQNAFKGEMVSYFLIKDNKKSKESWFKKLFTRPSEDESSKLQKLKSKIRKHKYNHPTEMIEIIDYKDFPTTLDYLEQQIEYRIDKLFSTNIWNLQDYTKAYHNSQLNRLSSVLYPMNSDLLYVTDFISNSNSQILALSNNDFLTNILIANWKAKYESKDEWRIIFYYPTIFKNENNSVEVGNYILRELTSDINEEKNPWEQIPKVLSQYYVSSQRRIIIILPNIDLVRYIQHEILSLLYSEELRASIDNNSFKIIISFNDRNLINRLLNDNRTTIRDINRLSTEEKRYMVSNYLEHYSKASGLDDTQLSKIISLETSIASVITMLDYMAIFSKHDTISTDVDYFTSHQLTSSELYDKILNKIETHYSVEKRKTIRELMGIISLSYSGIPENDVLELCVGLTTSDLSLLEYALSFSMMRTHGCLIIESEELRECIKRRYYSNEGDERIIREKLISFYDNSDFFHAYDELLFQYKETGNTKKLYELVAKNKHSISYLIKSRPADYVKTWDFLWSTNKGNYILDEIVDTYIDIDKKEDALACSSLFDFLHLYCSNDELAYKILKSGMHFFERAGGNFILAYAGFMKKEAEMLYATGIKSNIEKALFLLEESISSFDNSQKKYPEFYIICSEVKAEMELLHNEYAQNLKLFNTPQHCNCESLKEARRLYNQAEYLIRYTGELQQALNLYMKSLCLRKKHSASNLEISESNIKTGKCYYQLGQYSEALLYLEEGFNLLVELKGDKHASLIKPCITLSLCSKMAGDTERNKKYQKKFFLLLYQLPKSNFLVDYMNRIAENNKPVNELIINLKEAIESKNRLEKTKQELIQNLTESRNKNDKGPDSIDKLIELISEL